MFEEIKNLLSENELVFLQNKCNNFSSMDVPYNNNDSYNYYVRDNVNIKKDLLEYQTQVENYLFNRFKIKYKTNNIWINKITNETNKSDEYHQDTSDFTIITYLNDGFIGGEFVYLDDNQNIISIKPKKNMCILQNSSLKHKVNPVIDGTRYSCITFFNYVRKDIKTLI
jgi:hypothetical protein